MMGPTYLQTGGFSMRILGFLFLICTTFLSCSAPDQEKSASKSYDEDQKRAVALVKETEMILFDIKDRRVFASATSLQKQAIVESLTYIKNALLKIIAESDLDEGFLVLNTYLERFKKEDGLFIDEAKIADYKNRLFKVSVRLAEKYGKKLSRMDWILYHNRFSKLDPFTTISNAGDWETGWSLDMSYVRVRGYGNKSWLISPLMNFSNVKSPKLRIHHSMSVRDGFNTVIPLDQARIFDEAFKVMISEDYVNGDPNLATWREISLEGIPTGVNFHSVWSEPMMLKSNKDNVSVALLLDLDPSVHGKHSPSWQVNQFQIIGVSSNFVTTPRPLPNFLYYDDFSSPDIGENQSLALGENISWQDFSQGGSIKMAKVDASIEGVNTWLFTPKLNVSSKQAVLKLKEVTNNLVRENFRLKISTDYNGGDPRSSTWEQFDHVPDDFEVEPNSWQSFNSKVIDLSKYYNKTIVIGFQYISNSEEYTAWEIDKLLIEGPGEVFDVYPLEITYEREEEQGSSQVDILFEHDFSLGLGSFNQKKINQDAAVFTESERSPGFVEISGFDKKNNGITLLKSPVIKLNEDKNYLKLNQAWRFYKGRAKDDEFISVIISEEQASYNVHHVKFQKIPTGQNWNAVESEWYELPPRFNNKKVNIIFKYQSSREEKLFPAWNLYEVKLGKK